MAVGVALLVSLLVGPFLIPVLRVLKFGQSIRDDGPQRHLSKAGTPTIGGLIFLCGIVAAVLIVAERPYSPGLLTLLGITLGFGLLGFLDDFLKVLRKRNLGLRAKQKLAAQFLLAFLLAYVLLAEIFEVHRLFFLLLTPIPKQQRLRPSRFQYCGYLLIIAHYVL